MGHTLRPFSLLLHDIFFGKIISTKQGGKGLTEISTKLEGKGYLTYSMEFDVHMHMYVH